MPSRPAVPEAIRLRVYTRAAGRCTLCNRLVLENEDLGEPTLIGELAHNVGWSESSPRGGSDLSDDERNREANYILVCRNCHKPIDARGAEERYTIEELQRRKREHETRIAFLTGIPTDRAAVIVRLAGQVRGKFPELSYEEVLRATTASGLYPVVMPGSWKAEVDIDLRNVPNEGSPEYYAAAINQMDARLAELNDGLRRDVAGQIAVFAFARIPLLVHLGAQLDDKHRAILFQRQRTDGPTAWQWPSNPGTPPTFEIERAYHSLTTSDTAVVVFNVSGTIQTSDIPAELHNLTTYVVTPSEPTVPHPQLIDSSAALTNFEAAVRSLLALVERDGKPQQLAILPALPITAAITLGRCLMPNVSPVLHLYDRGADGRFCHACEVRR